MHTHTVQTLLIAAYYLDAVRWLQCHTILTALQIVPIALPTAETTSVSGGPGV